MRLIALPIAVLMVLAVAAPADARQRSFHTPSGNIACLYRSGGPLLRCDVHSLNDTAFTLDRRHRGKRVHVTDAVPAGKVLRLRRPRPSSVRSAAGRAPPASPAAASPAGTASSSLASASTRSSGAPIRAIS